MFPRFANPAAQLAAFRVATYATLLFVVDPRVPAHYALYPDALLAPPGFWGDVLQHGCARSMWHAAVTPEFIWTAYAIFVPACAMAMAGYRTRCTQLITILAAGFLLGIAQFYAKVNHYHHLLWFAMLLAVSPSGDALAIDSSRSRTHHARTHPRIAYELPLRFAWLLLVIIYFFPGMWKLAVVGVSWAASDNLIGILHAKWAETGRVPWFRVDHAPVLCASIGASTMVFELGFAVFTLAGKWSRRVAVAFGVLFHVSVWLAMDIRIGHVVIGYLAVIDVSARFAPGGPSDACRAFRNAAGPHSMRSLWPTWVVGVALVVGNVYNGVARREDWPLGMYPAFAWRAPSHHVTLEVVAELDDGTRRVRTPLDLARHTPAERAAATHNSALHDDASRNDRLRALWRLWCTLDPTLQHATHVRFERVVRLANPDALGAETERAVIGEFDVRSD